MTDQEELVAIVWLMICCLIVLLAMLPVVYQLWRFSKTIKKK